MRNFVVTLLIAVVVLGVWQVSENVLNAHRIKNGETSIEIFIASPKNILQTFVEDGPLILSQLVYTLGRGLAGLLLAIILAGAVSLLFLINPFARQALFPVSFALNSFPIVGFAPLIILIFGQGNWFAIVLISMVIGYFPILVAFDHSFKNVSSDMLEVMKVLNATKKQLILKLYLPAAVPGFLNSLKLAAPACIIGATIGEWLGTRNGIGQLVTMSLYQLRPGLLYASLISVSVSAVIVVALLSALEKRLLVWTNPS